MMQIQNYFSYWTFPFGIFGMAIAGVLFFLLAAWSLLWKGMSLWRAAHQSDKVWFVVLLVTNTAGILDILYLYVFSKKAKSVE